MPRPTVADVNRPTPEELPGHPGQVGPAAEESDHAGRLAHLREDYGDHGLLEDESGDDPIALLRRWVDDAIAADLYDPTAMVVATVSATGRPSARMVLLKGLDERGLVFYTNYASRKGEEIAGQPDVAVVFPWHPLQRQVRVEGVATRLDDAESDAYFLSRPQASQLGAWASPQSRVVESRAALEEKYAAAQARFEAEPMVRPPYWGGYRIAPHTFEFWQGRTGRMHDRLRFTATPTRPDRPWHRQRLAP